MSGTQITKSRTSLKLANGLTVLNVIQQRKGGKVDIFADEPRTAVAQNELRSARMLARKQPNVRQLGVDASTIRVAFDRRSIDPITRVVADHLPIDTAPFALRQFHNWLRGVQIGKVVAP